MLSLPAYNDNYQAQTNDDCVPDQFFIQEDSAEVSLSHYVLPVSNISVELTGLSLELTCLSLDLPSLSLGLICPFL